MRNEVIVQKLLGYTNKILGYCQDLNYEGVNLKLIWEIISDDLEPLRKALEEIRE